jgi:hypothetical protein
LNPISESVIPPFERITEKLRTGEIALIALTEVYSDDPSKPPSKDADGYPVQPDHLIEEFEQDGYAIHELSTLVEPSSNSIIQPLSGETKGKITVNAGTRTVIIEGLIDSSKLSNNKEYSLSCHLDDGIGGLVGMLYENGTVMLNENGVVMQYE